MFISHNIIVGIVKKSDLEKYWSKSPHTNLPFFEKFMSRNKFQSILWNLHICDDSQNPRHGQPDHYPLKKNFDHLYQWSKTIFAKCIALNKMSALMKHAAHSKVGCDFGITIHPNPIVSTSNCSNCQNP